MSQPAKGKKAALRTRFKELISLGPIGSRVKKARAVRISVSIGLDFVTVHQQLIFVHFDLLE
jgi:hypothetical protein